MGGEDELDRRARAAPAAIAAKPPEALRISRDLMRGNRDALVERIKEEGRLFTARLKSDETKQALMAFMNRKKG